MTSINNLKWSSQCLLTILTYIVCSMLATSAIGESTPETYFALQSRIDSLRAEANYNAALKLAKELLELNKLDKKTKKWEIEDTGRLIQTLKYITGLEEKEQQKLAEADRLTLESEKLYEQGAYAKAAVVAQKQLEIRKALLGNENAETIEVLGWFAYLLFESGDYSSSEPLLRKALTMKRKLFGDEHPSIATSLNSLARLLKTKGDYAESEPLYHEALTLRRKLFGDEHPDIAVSLNNLALLLQTKGDYAEAEPLLIEALAMRRKLHGDEHIDVAQSLNSLALLLRDKGNFASADPLFREALAMCRKLLSDEHPAIAVITNNIALLLQDKGDYMGAEQLYRESLAIKRILYGDEHPSVAMSLNNLALLLRYKGDDSAAEPLFREALAMRKKIYGDEHIYVATCLNNLALVLNDKGDDLSAEQLYREALAMCRKVLGDEHPYIATSLNNLAFLLTTRGDYANAEPIFREAHVMYRKFLGEEHPHIARSLSYIASILKAKRDYEGAEQLYQEAASVYEVSRLRAGPGLASATFGFSPYPALAATRLTLGQTTEAWVAVEKALGRVLADLLYAAEHRSLTPTEKSLEDTLKNTLGTCERELGAYQKAVRSDTTGDVSMRAKSARNHLLAAEAKWSVFQQEIANKYPITEGQSFSFNRIQQSIRKGTALIGWLDVKEGKETYTSWGYVIRDEGPVTWAQLEFASEEYRTSPFKRLRSFREELASISSTLLGVKRDARNVWSERIAPLSEALEGVKHLVVIPSGAMLGIPIEALVDDENVSISERYSVSYVPSATIYTWLCEESKKRKEKRENRTLLVGDPPFSESHFASMEEEAKTGMYDVVSEESYPDTSVFRDALVGNEKAIAALPRLPATREEVMTISSISPDPTLLVGADASEMGLVALAESGSLKEYSTIHIATHALVDDERPERSVLVFSQINIPDPLEAAMAGARIYDGLVTGQEIVREWRLDADLVTLSACETGLGKKVGGEGYIGFSHAFLQAGARSLLVSLWKVEDQATSLLMQRFYENYFGRYKDKRHGKKKKEMIKAEALQEAKRWLRNYVDDNGEKHYEHPYYWSAFILIGDRE